NENAGLEALEERLETPRARSAGTRLELDAADDADRAEVDHVRRSAERVYRVGDSRLERLGAIEQSFGLVEIERREPSGSCERVTRIRVSVKELDTGRRVVDDRFIDAALYTDGAHRHGGVGDPFGERHHVGRHAELRGAERRAESAETGDDLVED